jgi:GR25 family glycosyltransferase involved in LPS biosynthesis
MYSVIITVLVIISIFFLIYTRTKKDGFKTKTKKDYIDGVDVIYWINLDRSPDRRQRMEQMFKDPVFKGKKIVRVSAVDGKASNIDQLLNANLEGMQPDKFSKVEYACLLSHLNTIKQFSESTDETALIMEDDMTLEFKPYWKKTVKQIMDNAPSDWDIIQLCYITSNTIPNKMYTKNPGNIYSTGAYLINKKYKPTKVLNPNTKHSADDYLFTLSNTYVYKYPMFIYGDSETSTIHPDHFAMHNKSKCNIIQSLHYQ